MPREHVAQFDEGSAQSPELNGREALNSPRAKRLPSRVVYVPTGLDRAVPEGPDSTRIVLLPSGRLGVLFARDEEGRRLQKAVDTEAEAQALVADRRSRR